MRAEMSYMHPDDIRTLFVSALSTLYGKEVPQYRRLCELVSYVNAAVLAQGSDAASDPSSSALDSLEIERHGAIRLGSEHELNTMRRVFAVMGMTAVGYYDLAAAGLPVHSTVFRPIGEMALARNPFRVFTSLLRLDLLDDDLRSHATDILARRRIFSVRCLDLLEKAEVQGGLDAMDASEFVSELLSTFRWHREAAVDRATYDRMRSAHGLVADIVCFKGPHINHLTRATLDIDAVQQEMQSAGLVPKASIEGPPRRSFPILLRQTSFLAVEEPIRFVGDKTEGTHTARFGEVEQRGCALTRAGRMLYDRLLAEACAQSNGNNHNDGVFRQAFRQFPDDAGSLYRNGLAFFRYAIDENRLQQVRPSADTSFETLVEQGCVQLQPITYEDFLPVSAAGIFRSNLIDDTRETYEGESARQKFEAALGAKVIDEIALYEATQAASLAACKQALRVALPDWYDRSVDTAR